MKRNVCILGNKFYGYESEIINEINKNYNIKFIDYSLNTFQIIITKILGKKFRELLINIKIKKQMKNEEGKYDVLLIIGGQRLYKKNLEYLTKNFIFKKKILYLWDNIERINNFNEIKDIFNEIFSFDIEDCKKYSLRYRPTFYSKRIEKLKAENRKVEKNINLFFVGIYRKERYEFLKKIKNEKNYIYLYFPGIFFCLFKMIRKKEFREVSFKDIRFKVIKKEEYNSLFIRAKYILDIPEKNQTGLTQRILEALILEKKIITTQKNIINEKFYNNKNILIVSSEEELKENKKFFKEKYSPINEKIIKFYSIEQWVKDILEGDL